LIGGDTTVVLRGDREVPLQKAVAVMEQAKLAGAVRIVVATEQEGVTE
jgi:biopolymer transport protein ExbD